MPMHWRNQIVCFLVLSVLSAQAFAYKINFIVENKGTKSRWFSTDPDGKDQSCQNSSNPTYFWLKPGEKLPLSMSPIEAHCTDNSYLRYWVTNEGEVGANNKNVEVLVEKCGIDVLGGNLKGCTTKPPVAIVRNINDVNVRIVNIEQ